MKKWIKDGIIGLVSGVLNGMFGAGGGLAAVPLIEKLLKTEAKKAHATSIAIIMPLSLISAFLYLRGEFFSFNEALKFVPFGIVGAIAGGILLKKISNIWLRRIFGVVLIISQLRWWCEYDFYSFVFGGVNGSVRTWRRVYSFNLPDSF